MTKKLEEKHLALKKKGPNNENCQLTNNSHSCTVYCIGSNEFSCKEFDYI